MEQLDIEKAKQILGNLKCERGLNCVNSGLEGICKARDIGLKTFLVCLEEDPSCIFSLSFGGEFFCKCPVRVYIGKELGKSDSVDSLDST